MALELIVSVGFGADVTTVAAGTGTTQPQLVSALSTGPNSIDVTFDQDMLDFGLASVLKVTNWSVVKQGTSDLLPVLQVTKKSNTLFTLHTADQEGATYEVTVTQVESAWGQPIDTGNNDATFAGTAPTYPDYDVLDSFYGLDHGMQSENQSGFLPDEGAPYLQNLDPFNGQTNVSALSNITLEIIDDDDGVDEASVIIKVEGTTVWTGDAAQPGYAVTKTDIGPGYRYVINPDIPLPTGTAIDVDVYAKDLSPLENVLNTSYVFTTQATAEPIISVISPGESATGISENTTISFNITDPNFDLDPSKTLFSVDLTLAYSNLLAQNGFTVSRTTISGGFNYLVTAPRPFAFGRTIRVDITAADYSAQIVGKTYYFTIRNAEYCFDGPLNAFEQRLQTGFSTGLVALEHLRLLLLDRLVSGIQIEAEIRAIYLRAYTSDLAPVMLRLVPQPTVTEQAVRVCGWQTAVNVYQPVRTRFDQLIPVAIRELQGLGLPREHAAMFQRQAQVLDATVLVNLSCVLVMLGKALDSTELV